MRGTGRDMCGKNAGISDAAYVVTALARDGVAGAMFVSAVTRMRTMSALPFAWLRAL